AQAGDVTFNIVADDGFLLGVGGQALRVNGVYENPPASNLSVFQSYPMMAASDHPSSGLVPQPVTIHFPAPGTYPYEIDYFQSISSCENQLSLTLAIGQFNPDTSPLSLYVGYADGIRPAGSIFPFPWNGSSGVTFIGTNDPLDNGVIRFDNSSDEPIVLDKVTVDIGTTHWDIWGSPLVLHPIVVQPHAVTILSQTQYQNFDTSDGPIGCQPTGIIPRVNVTLAGVTTSYADTGQVLNTGGVDRASCGGPNGSNESAPWTRIGGEGAAVNVPLPPTAGTLELTPVAAQTATLGGSQPLSVLALDASGHPVPGLPITFSISGPAYGLNARLLNATTDANGLATAAYVGAAVETETVQAVGFVGGLREVSNAVSIDWTAVESTGGGDAGSPESGTDAGAPETGADAGAPGDGGGDAGAPDATINAGIAVTVGSNLTVTTPANNVLLSGRVTDPG
ncbi:MAG: Ig-like domain-containing protein, partial [Polyangiaceae bacterium]